MPFRAVLFSSRYKCLRQNYCPEFEAVHQFKFCVSFIIRLYYQDIFINSNFLFIPAATKVTGIRFNRTCLLVLLPASESLAHGQSHHEIRSTLQKSFDGDE